MIIHQEHGLSELSGAEGMEAERKGLKVTEGRYKLEEESLHSDRTDGGEEAGCEELVLSKDGSVASLKQQRAL